MKFTVLFFLVLIVGVAAFVREKRGSEYHENLTAKEKEIKELKSQIRSLTVQAAKRYQRLENENLILKGDRAFFLNKATEAQIELKDAKLMHKKEIEALKKHAEEQAAYYEAKLDELRKDNEKLMIQVD